ncbi:PP2C family protein-serine/threonine phosphatase [Lacrimispora sp.]|uniref:PP2C family protein-serine/threonine phosphatase n=1 Tax=Lacrimispora sp. TaxID=2719234 RepID=UPI0028AA5BE5|nr:PP2C family serine/threonine-protein phosphatase [Lacrimispora sp.]
MMMTIMSGMGALLSISLLGRIILFAREHLNQEAKKHKVMGGEAVSQTTGDQEIQADVSEIMKSPAGTLAILSDGMGKANTGKVCARIAADTLLDAYRSYEVLQNPEYFFKTSFREAHTRIQKTIGDRRGGACVAAVFVNGRTLHYGLAGNIRVALFRNQELIPISKGHTLDVLALNAFEEGVLTKSEAVWTMEETRIWNYLGLDGFHEIEVCEPPIRLKPEDVILLLSKGIYEALSWADIEDILLKNLTMKEKADLIVMEAERRKSLEKENGSVLLLKAEVPYEKN